MSGGNDKTLAMLCHLLGIFTGFIGALVIWLIKKDSSPEIDSAGKEALNFQITVAIAWVAAAILSFAVIGVFLYPVIAVGNLVFCIIASVKTNAGEDYKYPVCIRLIK
ncbi:MAG: DUF4870 domain-containing protein [Candidatus Omnitrophica bacterium]|nr:DUF4870 domain-containing protein [Candidatus Omnitrophota bacterium]